MHRIIYNGLMNNGVIVDAARNILSNVSCLDERR